MSKGVFLFFVARESVELAHCVGLGMRNVQDPLKMVVGSRTDDRQDDTPGAFYVLFSQPLD